MLSLQHVPCAKGQQAEPPVTNGQQGWSSSQYIQFPAFGDPLPSTSVTLFEEWTRRPNCVRQLPVEMSHRVPAGQQWRLSGQQTALGNRQHPCWPEVYGQQVSAVRRKQKWLMYSDHTHILMPLMLFLQIFSRYTHFQAQDMNKFIYNELPL